MQPVVSTLLSLSLVVLASQTLQAKQVDYIRSVSVTDAIDLGTSWAEVTMEAMGPGEHSACPNGRLFFATLNRVLATTLDGDPEALAANPWKASFRETFEPVKIYDNHLIKLKDGSLLYTFEGGTWNDNLSPRPDWWDWTVDYPAKGYSRAGARSIIYVFRSQDCGTTWSALAPIDAAKLVVPDPSTGDDVEGLCGIPRRWENHEDHCDGKKCASLGGWDGHFAYADPYNGDAYLSTPCSYGTDTVNKYKGLGLLLRSTNRGDSWTVLASKEGVYVWRSPLISVQDRVAFAYAKGKSILLRTFGSSDGSVDLANATTVKQLSSSEGTTTTKTKLNTHVWRFRSLAHTSTGFLISVPMYEDGALTYGIFHVAKDGSSPQSVGTIRALYKIPILKPQQGSSPRMSSWRRGDTIHGTFIPGRAGDNRSVFYWLESHDTSPDSVFRVRFQLYENQTAVLKTPGTLTIENGHSYSYPYEPGESKFVGDYMGGAVYRGADGSRNFVAAWSESGKLRFNTISVTYQAFPPPGPVKPLTVNIRPLKRIPIKPTPIPLGQAEAPVPATPQ